MITFVVVMVTISACILVVTAGITLIVRWYLRDEELGRDRATSFRRAQSESAELRQRVEYALEAWQVLIDDPNTPLDVATQARVAIGRLREPLTRRFLGR